LPALGELHLHTVDIGVGRADGVACPEPVGVRGAGPILPFEGLVNCDVIQPNPSIIRDHGGNVGLLVGIADCCQNGALRLAGSYCICLSCYVR